MRDARAKHARRTRDARAKHARGTHAARIACAADRRDANDIESHTSKRPGARSCDRAGAPLRVTRRSPRCAHPVSCYGTPLSCHLRDLLARCPHRELDHPAIGAVVTIALEGASSRARKATPFTADRR
jgi:hypothetical protein